MALILHKRPQPEPIIDARLAILRSGRGSQLHWLAHRARLVLTPLLAPYPSLLTHQNMAAASEKRKAKRPAAAPAESKTKKARVESSAATTAKSSTDKGKKRSQPVTLPVQNTSDASSDEGSEQEFDDEDEMDVDAAEEGPSQSAKDPNGAVLEDVIPGQTTDMLHSAARESHKAQRALLEQRKAAKPHSTLLAEAKRAWSLARQKNISKDERTKHINALMEVVRGKVKDIVFKHDASRIVQTIVKYGGQKERNEIAVELKGKYKDLAQNKYSKVRLALVLLVCI